MPRLLEVQLVSSNRDYQLSVDGMLTHYLGSASLSGSASSASGLSDSASMSGTGTDTASAAKVTGTGLTSVSDDGSDDAAMSSSLGSADLPMPSDTKGKNSAGKKYHVNGKAAWAVTLLLGAGFFVSL